MLDILGHAMFVLPEINVDYESEEESCDGLPKKGNDCSAAAQDPEVRLKSIPHNNKYQNVRICPGAFHSAVVHTIIPRQDLSMQRNGTPDVGIGDGSRHHNLPVAFIRGDLTVVEFLHLLRDKSHPDTVHGTANVNNSRVFQVPPNSPQ